MLEYKIDLSRMDKAKVLATLYNAAAPVGMGLVDYEAKPMTKEKAKEILDNNDKVLNYLNGRVMKIDLSGKILDPSRYDNYHGAGTALEALLALRETNQTNPKQVQDLYYKEKIEQAEKALRAI